MPHRHAEPSLLCTECKARTEHTCERCGRPLCSEHRPSLGKRCGNCEQDFADRQRLRQGDPGLLGTVGLAAGTAAVCSAGLIGSALWGMPFAVASFVIACGFIRLSTEHAPRLRAWTDRRLFLAEHRQRRLVGREGC